MENTASRLAPRTLVFLPAALFALSLSACSGKDIVHGENEVPYENFAALAQENQEGRDYEILIRDRSPKSDALVMAFHGGTVEAGTTELGKSIAGGDLSLYSFIGKSERSRRFHITSTKYDEPRLLAMLPRANRCLSLHGFVGKQSDFCVGGGDATERAVYVAELTKAFPEWRTCELCCPPNNGVSPKNVVNRCSASGKEKPGVQLEMSLTLRQHLLRNPDFRQKLAEVLRARLLDRDGTAPGKRHAPAEKDEELEKNPRTNARV